ncbi:UDP-glucose/GDP-mannose dehydrogenase family protein [Aureimonas flava]|uniref:UDP-glucose 6-dehydrogenase n=1 Tax=Aureimonas flava TaxID=2320271 RepID=A0A3A1WGQ2_9HYPH|nr:UDP-glucose/GDP-mannose dehydrogenase family protein [Aureimonas flava]RIX99547.1 UDP-glucose/GDP-mannose dehydrogenase family protein [Aureimonas flava]
MRITVVGTGYVGLVSGACLAELGHEVTCVDKDKAKIARLLRGELPIHEDGLPAMVARQAAAGRLRFSVRLPREPADLALIAVGTPPAAHDHSADLSAVHAAAEAVAAHQPRGRPLVLAVKSTVPVGTGDVVERLVRRLRPDGSVTVVSNPEFLREGSAIADFLEPDRIVVGTACARARALMREVYRPLIERGSAFVATERCSAEMIKYAANAFLAVKIAFINEMADLCEAADADIAEVSQGMGMDRRIGSAFLRPGPGYGGSCFPKDTEALLATAHQHGVQLRLVEGTVAANEGRKRGLGRRVLAAAGNVHDRPVAVLGATFKPGTDDVRESPALSVIAALRRAGAQVRVFDPVGLAQARQVLDGVAFARGPYDCVRGAHCVVVATEWPEFLRLDFRRIAALMSGRTVVDLRNCLPDAKLEAAGLRLVGIGRRERTGAPPPLAPSLPVAGLALEPSVSIGAIPVSVAAVARKTMRPLANGHAG